MCIICNVTIGDDTKVIYANIDKAEHFLRAFEASQKAMREAADALLSVSQVCLPDDRKRYDAIHKDMVRQMREWNRLEQKREHAAEPTSPEK